MKIYQRPKLFQDPDTGITTVVIDALVENSFLGSKTYHAVGVAKCNLKEDKFDPRLGKNLAETRATIDLRRQISEDLKEAKKEVMKLATLVDGDYEANRSAICNQINHLNKLVNE